MTLLLLVHPSRRWVADSESMIWGLGLHADPSAQALDEPAAEAIVGEDDADMTAVRHSADRATTSDDRDDATTRTQAQAVRQPLLPSHGGKCAPCEMVSCARLRTVCVTVLTRIVCMRATCVQVVQRLWQQQHLRLLERCRLHSHCQDSESVARLCQ